MTSSDDFPTGSTVPFPYETPYPQQVALMDTLLQSLKTLRSSEKPKTCPVYMLESPTGTGKSLSLACASVSWLKHVEQEDLQATVDTATTSHKDSSTGVDWVDDWVPPEERDRTLQIEQVQEKAREARTKLQDELQNLREKCSSDTKGRNMRQHYVKSATMQARKHQTKVHKRRKRPTDENQVQDLGISDDDVSKHDERQPSSSSVAGMLLHGPYLDGSSVLQEKTPDLTLGQVEPGTGVRKIIYAARTHTQLTQFVSELKRIPGGQDLRVVALGSRKALCGNSTVQKLSESAVNETCLDLQKEGGSSGKKTSLGTSGGCPLLASRDAIDTLALHTLVHPTDIEESALLGRVSQTCSYYATRSALPAAHVVVLPYSLLLSKQARSAVGLSLSQALVVVDEAHNLPEAVRSLHACRLSLPVVQKALTQLAGYVKKYADRLAGRNLVCIGQLRRLLLAIEKHLKGKNEKTKDDGQMRTAVELLMAWKMAKTNLFQLLRYMEQSRLSQKLMGFNKSDGNKEEKTGEDKEKEDQGGDDGLSKHVSAMSVVQAFLEKLALSGKEGKIVTDWPAVNLTDDSRSGRAGNRHPTLRYVLLQPSACFQDILEEAHALALVGGTLRPFVHVAAELLGTDTHPEIVQKAQVADHDVQQQLGVELSSSVVAPSFTAFTCDHVVSSSNVLLQCWSQGPSGTILDFRHASRGMHTTMDELGESLLALMREVPCGFVVFLPSYSYEAQLVRRWRSTGLWGKMEKIKRLYREPKRSQDVESTLQAYALDTADGAALFSVVGGKLSEGINFANDMARCVAVAGLPFPDCTDAELKEKMKIMDKSGSPVNGSAYYLNLCLRAVNQSVGRAIRHAQDYATIVLLDRRYNTDQRIRSGLPGWLTKTHGDCKYVPQQIPCEQRLEDVRSFFKKREHS